MTNISIRLATLNDLPTIRALWHDMVQDMHVSYPTNVIASLDTFTRQVAMVLATPDSQGFLFLGSVVGQEPDAFLVYEIQKRALGEPAEFAFVHYVYVRPRARSHGLLTKLASMAVEHMLVKGMTECEATVDPDAAKWWVDLGFSAYELRIHTHLPRAAIGLDTRSQRQNARIGNSHDAPVEPAPPQPADAVEETEP